ncbi:MULTISPECIES: Uma2 family endonuclease [Okeania]|uniref:Uma2 family endonuclease n=1 Tax=Okeania TaxID=1458928 RepID=UPI001961D966|nr:MULTISPECIES: Uma2 family endonuclease [Okeania]
MINTVALTLPEKRIVFYNLNWHKYQKILEALGENRNARIIYDQGILEITMPLEEHEFAREIIGLFIRILVFEMGLKIKTLGSTTLNYPQLDRGAEPDNCYYIQNQSKVAGKKIDLTEDPPPDLVVEVDITHTDINKVNLYASMGISEFWRYNGEVLLIYKLQNQKYVEVETSPTFPKI